MENLSRLALGVNQFTGMVPSSSYNISSITLLSLSYNQFHGSLPTYIASALPYLQDIQLASNHFTGPLPVSLSNISSLTASNKFTGNVPWNLGHLKQLQVLDINANSLGRGDANDLSFLSSVVNCTTLKVHDLSDNYFRKRKE